MYIYIYKNMCMHIYTYIHYMHYIKYIYIYIIQTLTLIDNTDINTF